MELRLKVGTPIKYKAVSQFICAKIKKVRGAALHLSIHSQLLLVRHICGAIFGKANKCKSSSVSRHRSRWNHKVLRGESKLECRHQPRSRRLLKLPVIFLVQTSLRLWTFHRVEVITHASLTLSRWEDFNTQISFGVCCWVTFCDVVRVLALTTMA